MKHIEPKARLMQATVNGEIEWRVYQDGEVVARFKQYNHAAHFTDYLNGRE